MRGLDRLRSYLDGQGVSYETHDHAAAFTGRELAEAEHGPGRTVTKVVMAFAGDRLVMLVLPADRRVNLDRLGEALGTPVRLAHEEEFTPVFADCDEGAMPPFGNLYGLPVWVDRELTTDERIVFNAGTHTQTVRMRYADFARLVQPQVSSLAETN